MEHSVIGKRIPNITSNEKVTGKGIFASDIKCPGMLYAKILRSPYPHAFIKNIDISEASRFPGVVAVVTGKDTLGINYLVQGAPYDDKPVLAIDKVRYVGDEIAAVAAVNERIAAKALKLIKVEYEELPATLTPEKAMEKGSPTIHERFRDNIASKIERKYGDIEKAFNQSDLTFENNYSTQAVSHCCLETRACVASFKDGYLDIWSSTQSPYFVRKEIAHVMGMSPSKIRIHEVHVGGGFGARSKICEDEGIAALLTIKTGFPVKIVLNREEELAATRIRHPMKIYMLEVIY